MKSSLKWIIAGLAVAGAITTFIIINNKGGGTLKETNAGYPDPCFECGKAATPCDPCPCNLPPIHDGTTVIHDDPQQSLSGRGPGEADCLNFDENCKLHFNYSGAINGKCNNNTSGVYATIAAKLYNHLDVEQPANIKFWNYDRTVSSDNQMTLAGNAFNYDPDCSGTCKAYFYVEITLEPPVLPLPADDPDFKTVISLTGHREGINISTPHDHALPHQDDHQVRVNSFFSSHTHEVEFIHDVCSENCNADI